MAKTKAYPISFAARFPLAEVNKEISEDHAAGMTRYCSACGAKLGYLNYVKELRAKTCPNCGAEIDWSKFE